MVWKHPILFDSDTKPPTGKELAKNNYCSRVQTFFPNLSIDSKHFLNLYFYGLYRPTTWKPEGQYHQHPPSRLVVAILMQVSRFVVYLDRLNLPSARIVDEILEIAPEHTDLQKFSFVSDSRFQFRRAPLSDWKSLQNVHLPPTSF